MTDRRTMDLVVNPAAGGGRAGRILGDVSRALGVAGFDVVVHRTAGRGHLGDAVRKLVAEARPLVGIMGGDGTFHDAMNALALPDGSVAPSPSTAFALVPAGTGSDLAARTFGMPAGSDAVAAWLRAARPRPFDLGHLAYTARDGAQASMLFTNIASCGIGGRVDELVAVGPKWLTGKASYTYATVRALAGWRHAPMRVRVDGEVVYEGRAMSFAVCNGRAFGGGMIIAPNADPADGLFDVIGLGDMGLGDVALNFPKIFKGTHLGAPKVHASRGAVIEIESVDTGVPLDIDGEPPGSLPARFTVVPGAVNVLRAS